MSVQFDRAMKRIRRLDEMACDANSLWRKLETEKMECAERAGISLPRLKAEGVFVEEDSETTRPRGFSFDDAVTLANGCHDYSGGHHLEPAHGAFHHGIDTVCNVLEAVAKDGYDNQSVAVLRNGRQVLKDRAVTAEGRP